VLPSGELMNPPTANTVASSADTSDIVEQKIAQLAESTRVQLQKLIALDSEPFTLNDHYLNDLSTKVFAQLKAKRRTEMDQSSLSADAAEARPQIVRDILAGYNKLGVDGLKEADLDKVLPVAEFERELKLMADTRAYWQVAYKVSLVVSELGFMRSEAPLTGRGSSTMPRAWSTTSSSVPPPRPSKRRSSAT